jgi:hypothetical protein
VLALIERLNLSELQGQAADALRAVQGTFPPALRNAAGAAESLQAAAPSWASRASSACCCAVAAAAWHSSASASAWNPLS